MESFRQKLRLYTRMYNGHEVGASSDTRESPVSRDQRTMGALFKVGRGVPRLDRGQTGLRLGVSEDRARMSRCVT